MNLVERALALYREEYGTTGLFENRVYDGVAGEKGELLAHLLTTEGIPAERAVMIGDREGDILAAHANGTWSIGVLWGHGSESELADVRPDALCASPGELASRVLRIAGSRPSR